MDFDQLTTQRQSVRNFQPKNVENEKINQILSLLNRAPSAGNLQAFCVYVITEPSKRAALAKAALNQEFIAQAPLDLVFCAVPERSEPRYGNRGAALYSIQDATIACTFAMLAATELGLGSVWVGAFDEKKVAKVIDAPEQFRPVTILPIGYSAEIPQRRPRRKLDDIVYWD